MVHFVRRNKMMRRVFQLIVIVLISLCLANPARSESIIPVQNASFESPIVDPNISSTLSDVDGWTQIDNDVSGSTNTGVFVNEGNHFFLSKTRIKMLHPKNPVKGAIFYPIPTGTL